MNTDEIIVITAGLLALLMLLILCFWIGGSGRYGYHSQNLSSTRFSKYRLSYKENLQKKVLSIFMTATDEEFDQFCKSIKKRINNKYNIRTPSKRYNTRMKRSVLDVINKNTHKIQEDRIRKVEFFFPLLHRVYFGPKLTQEIYSEELKTRKFHFRLREGEKTPEVRNIIDLALYFKTSVSVLLGYCYTQDPKNKAYYIKSKKPRRKEYKNRHYKHFFLAKRSQQENPVLEVEVDEKQKEIPYKKKYKQPQNNKKKKLHWKQHKRLISVPKYHLKMLQRRILHEILEKWKSNRIAQDFVRMDLQLTMRLLISELKHWLKWIS